MKRIVLKVLAGLLLLFGQQAISQVTQLSNNTSLFTGLPLNGKGLLFADRGDNDSLWVTNGTPAGTVRLVTNVSYVDSAAGALYNNKIFFAGESAANGGVELWASDATAGGTTLIKDINPTGNSIPADIVVFNNAMYFSADNGTQGRELWKSDGTTAGTVLLKDINAGAGSSFSFSSDPRFTICNGYLYFVANTTAEGTELWRTDGTTAGTTLVKDITTGPTGTSFSEIATLGTNLVFSLVAGTFPLTTTQVWKSDGSSAGTTMLKDFGSLSGLYTTTDFFLFNNKLYFSGTDYTNTGTELWVTDATVGGTTLVKDINPGGGPTGGSNPFLFLAVIINNKFYFQATTAAEGSEIWMSDGTTAGTTLLKDINPGSTGSNPIIYKAFDYNTGFSNQLYNGKVFFSATNGTNGTELWVTDGTPAGTTMVKDIKSGSGSGLNNSFSYFYSTSGLYFAADDGSGVEPWLSNGTDAGTARVADINPGNGSSAPGYLFTLNNQLVFTANNGDNNNATDLYRTDGTVFMLPVTLLNFAATVQTSGAVKLDWTTSTEINSSHFELERSIDGNKFSKVTEVKAAGNSSIQLSYSYNDQQAAILNSPVLYYRLKMVDKDGAIKTSPVLLVHMKEASLQFTIAPNPAQQQLNVTVAPAGAKNVALRIADENGKIVYTQALSAGTNVYQQNINVSRLQKGVYTIQLITDNTTTSQKFMKQ